MRAVAAPWRLDNVRRLYAPWLRRMHLRHAPQCRQWVAVASSASFRALSFSRSLPPPNASPHPAGLLLNQGLAQLNEAAWLPGGLGSADVRRSLTALLAGAQAMWLVCIIRGPQIDRPILQGHAAGAHARLRAVRAEQGLVWRPSAHCGAQHFQGPITFSSAVVQALGHLRRSPALQGTRMGGSS
ncbi:hypothetical protein WJX73_001571 [Symbiochloris irregularis]|uniref:Uncharacterized protein n=1 Tax=Symbiochloris irregularis TaxID=706552 RepID=A0AAW1PMB1_9CHLO